MEIQKIQQKIVDAMMLMSSGNADSMSLGIAELESIRPDVEEYIKKNPKDPDGHLEISKTYQIPMLLALTIDKVGPNERGKVVSLLMSYINRSTEYAKKAKTHLEEFLKLGYSDQKIIESVKANIQMLNKVIKE
jgi:hypothetical protein